MSFRARLAGLTAAMTRSRCWHFVYIGCTSVTGAAAEALNLLATPPDTLTRLTPAQSDTNPTPSTSTEYEFCSVNTRAVSPTCSSATPIRAPSTPASRPSPVKWMRGGREGRGDCVWGLATQVRVSGYIFSRPSWQGQLLVCLPSAESVMIGTRAV